MTRCFVFPRGLGTSPCIEKFHPTFAIEPVSVWKGGSEVLVVTGGSEPVRKIRLVGAYVKGMLACVVDCSQICRERSTSKRTGCEGKLWLSEGEYDQHVLIRAVSGSIGYSGGFCTVRSKSLRCLDGSYEQSDCINASKDDHESNDEVVEDDTGSEEHPREDQGVEEKHAPVTDADQVRGLRGEPVEHTKPGLQLCSDTSTSDYRNRMPAKSTERLQITSRGTHLESVEPAVGGQAEAVASTEFKQSLRKSFGEGAEPVEHIISSGGRGKEPQLAEGRSRSHEFFGERLGVVGSRDERSGVQVDLSGSWRDDLRGSEEQVSFHGENTLECNTNVGAGGGEGNDFGFDVEEFQTPHHGQSKHVELVQETESLSEFQTRGDNSQGDRDRQSSPSAAFESTQIPPDSTVRSKATSRLRSNPKEPEGLPVEAITGGRKISERPEAGAGRVGKGQENDSRDEGHLRKSEASLAPYERRVRPRLDGPAVSGRGEETEEGSTKIVRPSRPSGGKDRHSKVNTAKGPRDRRVRLSVPTAVQFYDVQDRLGYDQPSKAVEWLIKKAKAAIDELGRLPARGDGPSTLSDITHGSPYPPSRAGLVSGSSSGPASFPAALSSPFGDNVGNQMSYFIDSSTSQGMSFGNHPSQTRDVLGGVGLSQAHLVVGQGQLAGLSMPLGQTDLSRRSPGCVDGGKPGEFTGRVESRFKARERARERVKEKCTGRDCSKVAGDGSSPPCLQSPPLHQNPIHGPFPVHNARQSSVHSLAPLQNQQPNPHRSSIPSVFDTALSGILHSSQQGTLQNLIMQSPLQSPLADQVQTSLQHPFQASFESTLQLTSQSVTSAPNPRMQQQSHLQRSSLEGSTQRTLHLGSGFSPGPCSSSFSEAASLSSSDFLSISSIPISRPLSMSELASFGITSPNSTGSHLPKGNSSVQIPLGFSPGPPASPFRPRPTAMSQSCSESQPHPQDLSRPQGQLTVPSYSAAHALVSPGGSTSSKASTSLYYATTSSRMGSHQSISPVQLDSSSFSSVTNVGYDYQILQMMSPGRASGSYQTSSSQMQLPARILDDFDEELKSSAPSSPRVHP